MGSGSSGSYTGTRGGSQPYAEKYHVVSKALAEDKKDPDIYDPRTGYFTNPKAVALEDAAVSNGFRFDGAKPDGPMTYVLTENGELIVGRRYNPNDPRKRAPHPTLIGGKDPQVQCAGMITFRKGKIKAVDNQSGHYRPDIKSLEKVDRVLQALYEQNSNLFDKHSKWSKS